MNIFGVEITRARQAAEPSKSKQSLEIGDSGTRFLNGIVSEEYNPKLSDTRGIAIYDEMRKGDSTVRAAVQAVTLPIRAAEWYVKPASPDTRDVEIADFIEAQLFDNPQFTFDDVLREALLSLPFGVMVFEKVFGIGEVDDSTHVVWSKLAPRMPRSIQKWAIANDLPGITQNRSDGKPVEIPMEKLIVFVNEKEGDNWWGTSILRAAYKPWYIKTNLEKIDAIAHERQGLGVPKAKMPDQATPADMDKAETILKNMRANSQAFVLEPDGYTIEFMDMKAATTRDASPSLAYHSREIMKAVLAQFLELGSTAAGGTGGSRALSQDHSDLFLQSIESIARSIAATFNRQAIRELVDLNYDSVEEYPCLDFEGITTEDVKNLADTYQVLKSAGAMTAQDSDEDAFREKLSLPALDESGIRESQPQQPADPNNPANKQASEHGRVKKNFGEPFKPFRKLTFAEEKVDFQKLQDKMDELESQFDQTIKDLLHEARDQYIAAMTRAAHNDDTQAIKDATLKVQAEYARIIKNALKGAFEYGKTNAAKEIDTSAPANPSDMLRQIDIQSDAIANQHIAQIEADSKNAYVEALNKGESLAVALAAADTAAQDAIDALTSDASEILISAYINNGRGVVFDKNSEDIYALQRSEILDNVTCPYCESIDGRVVEKDDPFAQNTIFHSNCRGIWVAILKDEEDKPNIGGIPQTLRDRFGDVVNDLIQPKKPIKLKRK